MANELIAIEVAYATPEKQLVIPLQLPPELTVAQAISASGILQIFPEIDLTRQKVGMFSQICSLETPIKAQQRIEIYRPLQQSPMEARRNKLK